MIKSHFKIRIQGLLTNSSSLLNPSFKFQISSFLFHSWLNLNHPYSSALFIILPRLTLFYFIINPYPYSFNTRSIYFLPFLILFLLFLNLPYSSSSFLIHTHIHTHTSHTYTQHTRTQPITHHVHTPSINKTKHKHTPNK